jgi:hypothetical protein
MDPQEVAETIAGLAIRAGGTPLKPRRKRK